MGTFAEVSPLFTAEESALFDCPNEPLRHLGSLHTLRGYLDVLHREVHKCREQRFDSQNASKPVSTPKNFGRVANQLIADLMALRLLRRPQASEDVEYVALQDLARLTAALVLYDKPDDDIIRAIMRHVASCVWLIFVFLVVCIDVIYFVVNEWMPYEKDIPLFTAERLLLNLARRISLSASQT